MHGGGTTTGCTRGYHLVNYISEDYCLKNDIMLEGGTIRELAANTTSECKDSCVATTDCVAFTFLKRDNMCYLKNNTHQDESVGSESKPISSRMSCYERKLEYCAVIG